MPKPTHTVRVQLVITPPSTPDEPTTYDVVRVEGVANDGLEPMTAQELTTALVWAVCAQSIIAAP